MEKGIFCLFASILLLASVFTVRYANAASQATDVVEHFSLVAPAPTASQQPQSFFLPKKAGNHRHSFFPSRSDQNKVRQSNAPKPVIRAFHPTTFSQIDADYESGRLEEALWALQNLQKSNPDNADVLFRLGKVQEDMLDFATAVHAYEQAALLMKQPAPAYSRLANLQYKMKRYAQADAAFQNMLKNKPGDAYALYMLGMVSEKTAKFPEAIQYFKQAGAADASFKQKSLYGQGISYVHTGQHAQGKALLKQSIAIDSESDTAALARKTLTDTIKLENVSYVTFFGLYGFQYDSNVVLKPSTSASVPLIANNSDSEHVFMVTLEYAPPAAKSGAGYKLSARAYENLHTKLTTFDVTGIGGSATPYYYIQGKHLAFMDATYDYYLVNYKRYMDAISLRPGFTYTQNKQLQLTASVTGSRENYYQPTLLSTSNQDGLILKPQLQISGFSEDHQSIIRLGGFYAISTTQGSDWSYSAYGGDISAETPVPMLSSLMAGMHASIDHHRYRTIPVGFTKKRTETSYAAAVSLSYRLPYFDLGMHGSYTHVLSTLDVFTYVRILGGVSISKRF